VQQAAHESQDAMTTLDYHGLRIEEKKAWNPAALEASARKRDATFPEKVAALLPGPKEWLTAATSPVADKLAEWCELYLAGTAESPRVHGDRGSTVPAGRRSWAWAHARRSPTCAISLA